MTQPVAAVPAATGQTSPPNGKRGAIDGVFIVTVKDGKIAKEQSYWSELELMGQLGAMPPA